MRIRCLSVSVFACVLTAQTPEPPALPLRWDNYEAVRDRILGSPEDAAWLRIPWRSDLATAIAEAEQLGQPLLIWAMNGDPLGFT